MARLHHHRHVDLLLALRKRDQIAVPQTQLAGRGLADQRDVIPDDFGHRIRRFLHPRVVGESSVVGAVARIKRCFETCPRRFDPPRRRGQRFLCIDRHTHRRCLGLGHDAVEQ